MKRTQDLVPLPNLLSWITGSTQEELSAAYKKHLGGKILVVDDEPEIVNMIVMRLTAAGHQCIEATDGIEAAKQAKKHNPDVILMDIGMPNGDGHAAAWKLGHRIDTMMVPIIYLTARTTAADRDKALKNRAFDYITKPYTSERLLDAVERALEAQGRALEL